LAADVYTQKNNSYRWQGTWVRFDPDTVILSIFAPVSDWFEFSMVAHNLIYAGFIGNYNTNRGVFSHFTADMTHFKDTDTNLYNNDK